VKKKKNPYRAALLKAAIENFERLHDNQSSNNGIRCCNGGDDVASKRLILETQCEVEYVHLASKRDFRGILKANDRRFEAAHTKFMASSSSCPSQNAIISDATTLSQERISFDLRS
jgi:hypothetical protein